MSRDFSAKYIWKQQIVQNKVNDIEKPVKDNGILLKKKNKKEGMVVNNTKSTRRQTKSLFKSAPGSWKVLIVRQIRILFII